MTGLRPAGMVCTKKSYRISTNLAMRAKYGKSCFNLILYNTDPELLIRFGLDSVEKMVEWTVENMPVSLHSNVIEIGSGNGTLLVSLVEAGYDPSQVVGIDYSSDAIRLAESIAETHDFHELRFHLFDFLGGNLDELPGRPAEGWDLVMDKGTFDAMALMEKDMNGVAPSHVYPERVASIVKPGGYFLITCASFAFCYA